MKPFMDQDFLLENDVAKKLYHEYAENMPIYDYHCHISPRMIYENHQFENIGELMLGGDCMKALIETCTPYMQGADSAFKGKIVIGCAKGDLHDIGKSLVATQLAVNGYEVVDLGTDVSTNKFIDTAVAENADIIAVSSLLTTSQYYMEELIHRLTNEGKRDKFHIAIGGGPINPDYAEKIGADGYSRTADLAVKMADRLMAAAPQSGLISEV